MKQLATMMNGSAVPRSNTKWRSTMPPATVTTQMTMPVAGDVGDFHARATSQPTARAMRNGAATFSVPTTTLPPSSWLLAAEGHEQHDETARRRRPTTTTCLVGRRRCQLMRANLPTLPL